MRELPTGTVTFLFTDVEGSTRLLDELGADGFAAALAEHRRVLREAFGRHGGVEVDRQGDSFFVAFPTAPGALAAAIEGHAALEAGPISVRTGLHTGTAFVSGGDYVGMDVHRAARIAAAAHGGQVVLSATTAALVSREKLRDLGEHRFKDLSAPERVWQVGAREFPRLKSLYGTNLPVQPTPLIGRARELRDTADLLASHRLVTLTGAGGSGKTRLALQLAAETAERFADGVYWVPLQAVRRPDLVLPTIAGTVGAKDGLAGHIADKRMLLVLDNFEQLVEAAPVLGALLAETVSTRLLVTSRQPLHLAGEQRYTVEPLPDRDAVTLFLERARAVDSGFEPSTAVDAICRRLDGLPLAIELAAARVDVLDAATLLTRLEHSLPLLTGGARDAPERQRTLRATIEWSYALLSPGQQVAFGRLAVFAGSFDLEAADAVCQADLDTVQSLVDRSLVRRFGSGRFGMLETIHEYALERLGASPEAAGIRRRHAGHFAALAETAEPHARASPDQRVWLQRLEAEFANLREAVHWSLAAAPQVALRIAANLAFFFWVRGSLAEGRAWLDRALALAVDHDPRLRAKAMEAGAVIAERQGDLGAQTRFADDCFALYSSIGDEFGVASALREQAKAVTAAGDLDRARALYARCVALAERIGDEWNHAVATNNLGDIALREGDWERAVHLCGRSRAVRLRLGDRWGSALTLMNVALAELQLDRLADARRDFRQALAESVDAGSTTLVGPCLEGVAAAIARDRPREAARILGAADAAREDSGLVMDPTEQRVYAQTEATVRSELGPEAAMLELGHGRRLVADEAVRLALEVSG